MATVPLTIPLRSIAACFEAVIPSMLATVSLDGIPNVMALSDVHIVDDHHVAVSRQFFRKTHANLLVNPRAQLVVTDPATQETFRLAVRFSHEETSGPLFDVMAARLAAVAALTGMTKVFRLEAAVVFEVLSVEHVHGVTREDLPVPVGPVSGIAAIDATTQLRVLRTVSDALDQADDLDGLLDTTLATLDEGLGFEHSMILLPDETGEHLSVVASRGYVPSGIGAEVPFGVGLIGYVAESRRVARISSLAYARNYGRSIETERAGRSADEIALPGLPDAESLLAVPLVAGDALIGVLAVESRSWVAYGDNDELFLELVAGRISLALNNLRRGPDEPGPRVVAEPAPASGAAPAIAHRFTFYPADDAVFVDGHYLIRSVPGRILWKLLRARLDEGRSEFTNRELRLDAGLGLPSLRDNLESRLILLRKRLLERCPDVALVPNGRGRFIVELRCAVELEERSS